MRVKPEVLETIERLAASELRSVNAQVEILLREALARRGISRLGREPDDG
ncbi:toxin-antitoxin system HicB family antitoxin [Caulobacter mirabilis]|uniref:Toxin-antitoxin system HicB family antitoxin n=1 Tax=Caulobacter mirabilis TaxID=69666 RepID=A0A2D2AYL1_9CAUL|nr:toxin-antitoxin system HicB family antitoxin [Caulobacter mirabilis]ATQ43083.1 toxin-antitoxin system HicB family antitoxin [Caulobacter mirabilis]